MISWNGSKWSAPIQADVGAGGPEDIVWISCPSANFCAAADNGGGVVTFNGKTWSARDDIDDGLDFMSVSCPPATFCSAVGNPEGGPNALLTFNGTKWSAPQNLDESNYDEVGGVACASSAFCAAVDEGGYGLTFEDGTWSAPVKIAPGYSLNDVACVSATR